MQRCVRVRRPDGRSRLQRFSSNSARLHSLLLACFCAASQCTSKQLRFLPLCTFRTIRLGRYSRTAPCKTSLGDVLEGGARYTHIGAERVFTQLLRDIPKTCSHTGRPRPHGRRTEQACQQEGLFSGCRLTGSRWSGIGKPQDEPVFFRAPSSYLATWRAGRMTSTLRRIRATKSHCLLWCKGNSAFTSASPRKDLAQLTVRPLYLLRGGTAFETPVSTYGRHMLKVHRESGREVALSGRQIGRALLDRPAFKFFRGGLPAVLNSVVSLSERSAQCAQCSTHARVAILTYSNKRVSTFSRRVGHPPSRRSFVLVSGATTSERGGEKMQLVDSDGFLRGVDDAWKVCGDSDWKTYPQEQLRSQVEELASADEATNKGLINGALYDVQRFPAATLASTPSSGRLHTEQARGRDVHLERVAADNAAAGDRGAESGEGYLQRERPRRRSWRDYLSWLPPPQPPYISRQRPAHRGIFHESNGSGEDGSKAGSVRVRSSSKEEHSDHAWDGFPPLPSTKIDDLPLETLVWGNETLLYRQAFEDAPMIIDNETFERLQRRWMDAEELKRVQREEKGVYGIPEDVPDDCWIPISSHLPEGRLFQKYGLVRKLAKKYYTICIDEIKMANITLTEEGYDYIETYHDPARNYTWAYKRWNPLKQEGLPPRNEGDGHSIYDLDTEKNKHYWHEAAHPPSLQPDDGIFRQATIADEMIKGMKRTPPGMDQWNYTPTHPLGQAAELQSFWLTAVKRTLPEAKADAAAEAATAAVAAAPAPSRLPENTSPVPRPSSGSTSERALQTGLPLWVRRGSAEEHTAGNSLLLFSGAAPRTAGLVKDSPGCHFQPHPKINFYVECTLRADTAECGAPHGYDAACHIPVCGRQKARQVQETVASSTKCHPAGRTGTPSLEAVDVVSCQTSDVVTKSEGAGRTGDIGETTSGAVISQGRTGPVFRVRRSAYQPLACYDAENEDGGAANLANNMKYRQLGKSDLFVSEVGLGTMTVGSSQLDEKSTQELLTYAVETWGVNFIDTAELYPLPAAPHTYGRAEEIIGRWLQSTGRRSGYRREELVIATKVAGPSSRFAWLRNDGSRNVDFPKKAGWGSNEQPLKNVEELCPDSDKLLGAPRAVRAPEGARWTSAYNGRDASQPYAGTSLSKAQIKKAAEGSIRRLQTDYIDLFQLHWPDRYVPMQNSGDAAEVLYDPQAARHRESTRDVIAMEEQLEAIEELLREGKLHYNLLCRNDVEKGYVELARPQNAGIGLLAYGALAGGILTGKYLEWLEKPTTGRLLRFPSYMRRYRGSLAARAVTSYYYLALRSGHPNLTVMALRWVLTRPFVCSTLLGVSGYYQLRENLYCTLSGCGIISDWTEREINYLHWKWRDTLRIIQ